MKGAMSSEVATLTCFICHAKLSCWVPDRDVLKISDRDDLIWKTYKFRALGSQSRVGRFGAKICGFHLAVEGINGQWVQGRFGSQTPSSKIATKGLLALLDGKKTTRYPLPFVIRHVNFAFVSRLEQQILAAFPRIFPPPNSPSPSPPTVMNIPRKVPSKWRRN